MNASKDFKFVLNSLSAKLESLPSKASILIAKDLASLALSAAIALKHYRDTCSRLSTSNSIPGSAKRNFAIEGSKKVLNNKEFKEIVTTTAKEVEKFELYLKSQIIKAKKCELVEHISAFQHIIIHNSLMLSNNLVRYY